MVIASLLPCTNALLCNLLWHVEVIISIYY
jgi:hypothetical protein